MSSFEFTHWPTIATPEKTAVTRAWGDRPELYIQFGYFGGHEGIDLVAPIDSRIVAVADGEVEFVGDKNFKGEESPYGMRVVLKHQDGFRTLYAHLRKDVPGHIRRGVQVKGGDLLGFSGNTGNSSGPHLHLTLKKEGVTYPRKPDQTRPGTSIPEFPDGFADPTPFLESLINKLKQSALVADNDRISTEPAEIKSGRTIDWLNLRAGPGIHHPSLLVMPVNEIIKISGQQGKWLEVTFNNVSGFAHEDFIEVFGDFHLPGFINADTPTFTGVPVKEVLLAPPSSEQINDTHPVATTWNRLGGLIASLSTLLNLDPGVALAVWMVESSGSGFVNNRLKIRFENHIFFSKWGQHNGPTFETHFRFNEHKHWQGHKWRASANDDFENVHSSQASEWRAFDFAASLNEVAAKLSISMGGPQIMGFNHSRIGYETVLDMFADFAKDERYHVISFFNFIKGTHSSSTMVQALQKDDFVSFSEIYNGSLASTHAARMREFYTKFKVLRPD